MGGSSSKSSQKPVDVTPGAFKNLQEPFAKVVEAALPGIPQGTERIVEGYQGPTTTPLTANEQAGINQIGQYTSQLGSTPAQLGPAPTAQQVSPFGQALSSMLLGNTAMSGMSPDAVSQFVNALGIGGGPQQSLNEFQAGVAGASQTGAFGGANSNPFLQQYIEAAQRPTQQALEETLSRTLPGRFTQAGQFVQPGSSSAFDRAAAIATRGAADALGDIGTNISYQALEATRGREAESLMAELGRRGQAGLQTQALTSQAQQSQLDRALGVPGALSDLATASQQREGLAAQQGLTEAQRQQTGGQIQSQELQNMIQGLQAQALPRLIQDLGDERGIEAFNNNVNALLSSMGIAAGVTRPVIAQEGKSSSKGFSL